MATQITVTGTIADPSGTALTSGAFVRFKLRNYQGYVPKVSGTSIICETQIDAQPDGSGNISQALWKNSDITPSSTYWTVEFWSLGRITSSGNYIFNANASLNSASQINTPPVPAGFSLVLENNGTLNSSQSTLNLESTDASVTITDVGGGTLNLQAASGASSGANVLPLPALNTTASFPASVSSTVNAAGATNTFVQYVPGNSLFSTPAKWNLSIFTASATTTVTMQIAKCAIGSNVVLSTAAVTFGGSANPVLSGVAQYTSDNISFPLSTAFDYFFLLNSSTGLMKLIAPGSSLSAGVGTYVENSNMIGQSTLTFSGGTAQFSKSMIFSFNAA